MLSRRRVLHPAGEYWERLPGSMYEQEVEEIVLQFAHLLLPDFFVVRCKPFFDTPYGGVKPDLVAVRRDLSGWSLIEVELEEHPIGSHVKPQIGKLKHALANENMIACLVHALAEYIRPESLEVAVAGNPRVILITHGKSRIGQDDLRLLGVDAINIQIFRGQPNNYQVIAEDVHSIRPIGARLERSRNPLFAQCWTILGDVIPELEGRESLTVTIGSNSHTWSVRQTSDGYLLRMPSDLAIEFHRAEILVEDGYPAVTLKPLD